MCGGLLSDIPYLSQSPDSFILLRARRNKEVKQTRGSMSLLLWDLKFEKTSESSSLGDTKVTDLGLLRYFLMACSMRNRPCGVPGRGFCLLGRIDPQ